MSYDKCAVTINHADVLKLKEHWFMHELLFTNPVVSSGLFTALHRFLKASCTKTLSIIAVCIAQFKTHFSMHLIGCKSHDQNVMTRNKVWYNDVTIGFFKKQLAVFLPIHRPVRCPDEIYDVICRCHKHGSNERITFNQIVEEFSREDILKLMGEKEIAISGVH